MSPLTRCAGAGDGVNLYSKLMPSKARRLPEGEPWGADGKKRRTQEWGSCVRGLGAGRAFCDRPPAYPVYHVYMKKSMNLENKGDWI